MNTNSNNSSIRTEELFSTAIDRMSPSTRARAVRTRDHGAIRGWALRHQAEPATGEATPSGPATTHVMDGGTGLRFNFPGFAPFRPIGWDEWFDHFEAHDLAFVYEEEVADRAHELSEARGGEPGHDWADWFEAERQLGKPAAGPGRFRIVKAA
jgi:hypothetical protein